MRKSQLICSLLALALCLLPAGCRSREAEEPVEPENVTLIIKTPPIGLGNIPDVGEAGAYDLIMAAAERFKAQYNRCDVEFVVSRYDYLDEQTQLMDKYGTPEAADLFFSGSWNLPLYVQRGWMVPLDDIISEELRSDIDESIWRQNTIDGKVYTLPFHQLQNTLMVNREMMEAAGLEAYIPEEGAVACWSTEEFRLICRELAKSLTDENTFAFMMYAANNQGDSHIMTLLRAYGCPLYDKELYRQHPGRHSGSRVDPGDGRAGDHPAGSGESGIAGLCQSVLQPAAGHLHGKPDQYVGYQESWDRRLCSEFSQSGRRGILLCHHQRLLPV